VSRKNQLLSYKTINSGTMTGTSTLTSDVTDIRFLDDIGVQMIWTGSPVGNFQIQVSADYAPGKEVGSGPANPGNWTPLTLTYWNGVAFVTSTSVPTTYGPPYYFDLVLLSAPWIRVVYTNTSGSGVLTATITGKAV
jgi:hypothetical protein